MLKEHIYGNKFSETYEKWEVSADVIIGPAPT